ncbi:MAG: DUF2892 domain-containing protein [Patescibacteria group bacterium]|nr:DUF2892 domain-containing protein [Patescibacteria group bacterium]
MKLKKNIGTIDKKIRIILGILMIFISISIDSLLRWFLFSFGFVLIITALLGFCGLYTFFGINTCKLDKKRI